MVVYTDWWDRERLAEELAFQWVLRSWGGLRLFEKVIPGIGILMRIYAEVWKAMACSGNNRYLIKLNTGPGRYGLVTRLDRWFGTGLERPSDVKVLVWALIFRPGGILEAFIHDFGSTVYYCLFSCWVVSNSLWPHGLQHASFFCPPLSPRVC